MNTLHIVKVEETYRVYYNKRENEYQSLGEVINDNCLSRYLKDYVLEVFRHTNIKRLSVWGPGGWWWVECETKEGVIIEEEDADPIEATAALLLCIEAHDKE